MKNIIKEWWPLLLIAAWWLWKRNKKQPAKAKKQTVTLHDGTQYVVPDLCPRCGSIVDHAPGNKSLTAKCTNPDCSYSVCYPMNGAEAGECPTCGSTRHYRTQGSPVDGCSIINFPVCDNPTCPTHSLDY